MNKIELSVPPCHDCGGKIVPVFGGISCFEAGCVIPRDRWHKHEVTPNEMNRIMHILPSINILE